VGGSIVKKKIIDMLEKFGDGVSFADLSRIDGFKGTNLYGLTEQNIYFWFNCSKPAIDAIDELIEEGVILLKCTDPFVYYADGLVPKYPLAKQPNRKYVNSRWLPVAINRVHGRLFN